jgi:hypothetical protein
MFSSDKQIRDFLASNEFTSVCTGDMRDEDEIMFYIMNPEESDQPLDAQRQKEYWKRGCVR